MSRASDRAYAEIRRLIQSGEAAPGMQLKEEQLAQICGVSRTPIRDALRRLEADLYIVRSGTQRVFVADWKSTDVEEMFTLRGMLEAHAAARAATRMDTPTLERLRAANARIERAVLVDVSDVPTFLDANREFHNIIIEAADSDRLAGMLVALVDQPIIRRTAMQYDHDQLVQSAHDHQQLIQAIGSRDAEWARTIMLSHIRRAYQAFVKSAV